MQDLTEQEFIINSMKDSINVINAINFKSHINEDDIIFKNSNIAHLKIILKRNILTAEEKNELSLVLSFDIDCLLLESGIEINWKQPTVDELEQIKIEEEEEILQKVKNNKIKAIDSQTSLDIESLVGDNNKQKDLLAESIYLSRLEKKDIATPEQIERLDLLESLNMQVLNLKYDGNNREAIVSNVEITTTLENALAEIEAI